MIAVAVLALLLPLLPGCDIDRGTGATSTEPVVVDTTAPVPETFALGTRITPSAAVPQDAATDMFPRGGEIFLSVNVRGASTEQKIAVEWIAPNGAVMAKTEQNVPQQADYVAFSPGATHRWPAGQHRAVVIIDGRRVAERPFGVI